MGEDLGNLNGVSRESLKILGQGNRRPSPRSEEEIVCSKSWGETGAQGNESPKAGWRQLPGERKRKLPFSPHFPKVGTKE